jgi:hypothetical protein
MSAAAVARPTTPPPTFLRAVEKQHPGGERPPRQRSYSLNGLDTLRQYQAEHRTPSPEGSPALHPHLLVSTSEPISEPIPATVPHEEPTPTALDARPRHQHVSENTRRMTRDASSTEPNYGTPYARAEVIKAFGGRSRMAPPTPETLPQIEKVEAVPPLDLSVPSASTSHANKSTLGFGKDGLAGASPRSLRTTASSGDLNKVAKKGENSSPTVTIKEKWITFTVHLTEPFSIEKFEQEHLGSKKTNFNKAFHFTETGKAFYKFAVTEYSTENFDFLIQAQAVLSKKEGTLAFREALTTLNQTFIVADSPRQVNTPSKFSSLTNHTEIKKAMEEIFNLVTSDTWPRFKKSPLAQLKTHS